MRAESEMTEQFLRRLDAAGRQKMLAELFEGHRDRLRRMVDLRLDDRLRARIDPSDVLQETFIEASRRLAQYVEGAPMPFFLWLRRITAQKLVDLHRYHLGVKARDARRETPIAHADLKASSAVLAAELATLSLPPCEALIRVETENRVRKAIESMDALDREVLALRHFERLTNSEVAAVLGLDVSAASKRHSRALEKLKDLLEGWNSA